MKKTLLLILALACMLTMISCGDEALDAFAAAGASAAPSKITMTTSLKSADITLSSSAVTTFADNGSFTLVYTADKLNLSGEGDDLVTTVETTVTCDENGNYSDGGSLAASGAATTGHKLAFKPKLMTYTVSPDGDILSATVKAENTEAVFGINYGTDVTLVATKNDGKITSFTLNYTVEAGDVEIKCNYEYPAAAE